MNELNKHKRKDKIKWVLTGIAFLLVFVILIGLTMQLFGNEKLKPGNWFKKTECVHIDEDNDGVCDNCKNDMPGNEQDEEIGGTVVTDVESHGIRLMSARIASEEFEDYGISPQADSAIVIKATITPANASVQAIEWSYGWVNENSAWASGKDVKDYYGFASFGTLLANAVCFKPFGEPIWVRATSVDNPDVSATATAEYVKRIIPKLEIIGVTDGIGVTNKIIADESYILDLTETYTDGTKEGAVQYSNFKEVFTSVSGSSQVFGDLEDAIYHEYNETKQSSDPHMDACTFLYDGKVYAENIMTEIITKECDYSCSPRPFFECISDAGKKLTNQRVMNAICNQVYSKCGADTLQCTVSIDYVYTYNGATYGTGTLSKTFVVDCTSLGVAVTGMSLNKNALIF